MNKLELKIIEQTGIIKIYETDKNEKVVQARELHQGLRVTSKFADWVKNRINECDAVENEDYLTLSKNLENGGRTKDYILKLDTAKEMAMLERNNKGKEYRRYFIEVEKRYKQGALPTHAEALRLYADKLEENEKLALENESMKPKVIFADAVSTSHTTILVGELAKLLKQNGINLGQNRLFDWLRENGYLIKRKGEDYNSPTQKSMELKLFEVKERTINNPEGSVRITKTTKVTGKGQQYFINKFLA